MDNRGRSFACGLGYLSTADHAQKGLPSRAEVTDAAMAQRADCVMLNKGTYILNSMAMLDDIMKRMQQHQYKKTPLLRKLNVSNLEASLEK